MIPPFDFSPILRGAISDGVERKVLCSIAGVYPSTLHRWENPSAPGDKPNIDHLRRWCAATGRGWAFDKFRKACEQVISPPAKPTPSTPTLDADGDGRVTVLDLRHTNSQKQLVSARRSVHQDIATADGVVSREEAAVDAQLAREERGLSEKGELISRHLSLAGAK